MREQELKDIRDVVLKVEAVEEEKQKGTAKGFIIFENGILLHDLNLSFALTTL
jgi:hypothetical protein